MMTDYAFDCHIYGYVGAVWLHPMPTLYKYIEGGQFIAARSAILTQEDCDRAVKLLTSEPMGRA